MEENEKQGKGNKNEPQGSTSNTRRRKGRWLRRTLRVLGVLVLLLALLVGSLNLPWVQTRLVNALGGWLTRQTGFTTTVERVSIRWLDTFYLEGLRVEDQYDSTMLAIKGLQLDYNLNDLVWNANLVGIEGARLFEPQVLFQRHAQEDTLNITLWAAALQRLVQDSTARADSTPPKPFSIEYISLHNGQFVYYEPWRDSVAEGFDFFHFALDSLQGQVSSLVIKRDTFALTVGGLSCRERATALPVHSINTRFEYSPRHMAFKNLEARIGQSVVGNHVHFSYPSVAAFSDFLEKVRLSATFDATELYTQDLALMAPQLGQYEDRFRLQGSVSGTVSDFQSNDLEISFGRQSRTRGNIWLDGLPSFENTFLMLDLAYAETSAQDLAQYVGRKAVRELEKFGLARYRGTFTGFPLDFVTDGFIETALGNVELDLNLKIEEDMDHSTYSGAVKTVGFRLGDMIGEEMVGRATLAGQIKGTGFTKDVVNVSLNATIDSIGLMGYTFQNLTTNASLKQQLFEGSVKVVDPNLAMEAKGLVDLRQANPIVSLTGRLDSMHFRELGIMQEEGFLAGSLAIEAEGLALDSIKGSAIVRHLDIGFEGRKHWVDSLAIVSTRKKGRRTFAFETDRLGLTLEGNYHYTPLIDDVLRLLKEYRLNLENQSDSLAAYYAEKQAQVPADSTAGGAVAFAGGPTYALRYRAVLKNINPFVQLFAPDLYLAHGTILEGSFSGGYTSILSLFSEFDTVRYGNVSLYGGALDVSTSKMADQPDVLASLVLESARQEVGSNLPGKNLFVEAIWADRQIDFITEVAQGGEGNDRIDLAGDIRFLEDTVGLHLSQSKLTLLDVPWVFDSQNQVWILPGHTVFDHMGLSHEEEQLSLKGVLGDSLADVLRLDVANLSMAFLEPITGIALTGEANGHVALAQAYAQPLLTSDFTIDDFTIGGFLLGNVKGKSLWDYDAEALGMDWEVIRDSVQIIALSGDYLPTRGDSLRNMVAILQGANLNVIQPFIKDEVPILEGVASGRIEIGGTLGYPLLNGTGTVRDGQLKLGYMGTHYAFAGGLAFGDNEIIVDNMLMVDEQGNKDLVRRERLLNNAISNWSRGSLSHAALLNGGIYHDGFSDMVINVLGDLKNFQVINTGRDDNSYYYGEGYVSGDVEFLGAPSNLMIEATVRTEANSKLFIPLSNSGASIEQEEFITFVSAGDTLANEEVVETIDLTGVKMDLDLEITPDAYVEMIYDITAGDIIRGRGRGDLSLEINTDGDFNMFGEFAIEEGGYNFTLYNLINKEFLVQPGSRIFWVGDPYEGVLNLTATYDQHVQLVPILPNLDEAMANSRELRRGYPTSVLLNLTGILESPDIDFDITVSDYPVTLAHPDGGAPYSLETALNAFNAQLATDEQELKRQVFSLILLRRFSSPESFDVGVSTGGGGSVQGSVSELLSNQLSYWITQVDENLEFDIDLATLDENAFNTFQLRLSYSFLGGRLVVTRDGGFVNQQDQADVNSIAGDWTAEYLLSEDGKFKVRMYRRNNFNNALTNSGLANSSTTTGFSFQHVENFDRLREIWSRKRGEDDAPGERGRGNPPDAGSGQEEPTGAPAGQNQQAVRNKEE